jgi:hypothetical protein
MLKIENSVGFSDSITRDIVARQTVSRVLNTKIPATRSNLNGSSVGVCSYQDAASINTTISTIVGIEF